MRKLLIAGALLCTAAPALAQPPGDYDDEDRYEAPVPEDALTDPRAVDAAAQSMDRLVGAIMNLPVGGIMQALDPYNMRAYPPNATIGELASRDDPYAMARIHAGIQGATRSMHAVQGAVAHAMPALRRSIEEIRRSMEAAIAEADGAR